MVDEPPRSAHVDQFVRQRLPPADLWPRMEWSGVPELAYPDRLNCAEELLDRWIAAGDGDRIVFHHAAGSWSYRRAGLTLSLTPTRPAPDLTGSISPPAAQARRCP